MQIKQLTVISSHASCRVFVSASVCTSIDWGQSGFSKRWGACHGASSKLLDQGAVMRPWTVALGPSYVCRICKVSQLRL